MKLLNVIYKQLTINKISWIIRDILAMYVQSIIVTLREQGFYLYYWKWLCPLLELASVTCKWKLHSITITTKMDATHNFMTDTSGQPLRWPLYRFLWISCTYSNVHLSEFSCKHLSEFSCKHLSEFCCKHLSEFSCKHLSEFSCKHQKE